MRLLFDHKLLRHRLRRASFRGADNPFLAAIAEELPLRLAPVRRDFETALNLFPPSPQIEAALAGISKIANLRTLSIDEASDFETLPLTENSFDLMISCLGLQYANDLPGVLTQLQRALKPGGLLLGCLMGGDTLRELREAFGEAEAEITGGVTPRVHPSIDIRQMGALMQRAKFAEPIIDLEKFELVYADTLSLLKNLRKWSAGNLLIERSRRFLSRAVLKRMLGICEKKFGNPKGRITIGFDVLWFSGWAD